MGQCDSQENCQKHPCEHHRHLSSLHGEFHSRQDKKEFALLSVAFMTQMWHAEAAVIRDSEGTQMEIFSNTKSVIAQLIDIGMSLVALAIVLSILIGGTLPFFGSVVANLTGLVNALGSNGLVGLIVVGMIMWLFSSRTTMAARK